MTEITDAYMNEMRAQSKDYAIIILKKGPNYMQSNAKDIIWEHGRRNFALRAEGKLSIVCPVLDKSEFAGIGVFNCSVEEATKIYENDPAIKAGVLTFDGAHPSRSFPGDSLPSQSTV